METSRKEGMLQPVQALSLQEQVVQLQRCVIRMAGDMRRIVDAGMLTNEALMLLADEVLRLKGEEIPGRTIQ